MKRQKAVGVIPARYASYRFVGKVIHPILEKPMIWHVYSQAKKSRLLDDLIVATEDERVMEVCQSFSIPVMMTSNSHQSGTERVIEVSRKVDGDLFVNIQGDEPMIRGEMIDSVVEGYLGGDFDGVITLKKRVTNEREIMSPHIVKVVTDSDEMAMYFSRSVIPYSVSLSEGTYHKHIGLYGYPREVLEMIPAMPIPDMEKMENLEQLRLLNRRIKIKVIETEYDTIGVDVPEDISLVENYLRTMALQ